MYVKTNTLFGDFVKTLDISLLIWDFVRHLIYPFWKFRDTLDIAIFQTVYTIKVNFDLLINKQTGLLINLTLIIYQVTHRIPEK